MRGQKAKLSKKQIRRQIKTTLDETHKALAEDISQTRIKKLPTPAAGINYQAGHYKKNRALMWALVIGLSAVVLVMWGINLGSVFYDWNRDLRARRLPASLENGGDKLNELFSQGETILNQLTDNSATSPTSTETKSLDLANLAAAIINFTSNTIPEN